MAKRISISTDQLSGETKQLFDVLNQSNDHSVILIAANFIDACLVSILESTFVAGKTTDKLLHHSGIVGSLLARAQIAYVLGKIPKNFYTNIVEIAEIRNAVAHHRIELTFEDTSIREKCANLDTLIYPRDRDVGARDRFVLCTVMLTTWLLIYALEQKESGAPPVRKDVEVIPP